ncbi:MAG: molybdopterin-dependent oxidoreductase [Nitrospirota bacterium]
METISIRIDDKEILTQKGANVLETALSHNIYIPHLCYHPDLKPAGSCRVCLVEMDDGKLASSCRTPVKDGMVIKTKSPELDKVRRPIIEMIMANHHMDCRNCLKKGQCVLQRIRAYMKIDKKSVERLRLPKEKLPVDDSNPFFIRDHNKCVLCGICVRTCQEIQRLSAIDFTGRGNKTKIATFGDKPIAQSACVSCGECVIRCPVGALILKNPQRPALEIQTICPHCAVGCGIFVGIRDNKIVNVRGDKDNPSNNGYLCVKGRFGLSFVHSPDRLTTPLIRQGKGTAKDNPTESPHTPLWKRGAEGDLKGGKRGFVKVSWDEALDVVAKKLKKFKGEEFAIIASTKCTNEENYIVQKFARVVMGSNNIDTSVRLCHGPSIAALQSSFTLVRVDSTPLWEMDNPPSPPFSKGGKGGFLSNIEEAACILIAGADITCSHPVLGLKVKRAIENGAKLIVINPKEIDLCRFADIWLKPYPGTDLALIMGICKVIFDEEMYDTSFIEKHCDKFEDFKDSLDDFTSGRVERITGVPRDSIEEAAKVFAANKPVFTLWSDGITQYSQGTNNVLGLINLSLLTGNTILNPLWGQNNALGACEAGCLPDFYPGFQPLADSNVRKRFESVWGANLNQKLGLTQTEVINEVLDGKIKALYIIGSNLSSSMAPSKKVEKALKKLKLVVLQDSFMNETAMFAHFIFPAASFVEKDGTFTNIERRIQRINKALEPIGNAWPDWKIICELAKRLGGSGFDFSNSEEIMSEISSVTTGIPDTKERFNFTPLQYRTPAEVTDIDYPLILTTEKNLYSCGFLSRKVEGFDILKGDKDLVYINPKDSTDFEIEDEQGIKIISRNGKLKGTAKLTNLVPAGLVAIELGEERMNQLIDPVLDPVSKTPEIKICAVRIEK